MVEESISKSTQGMIQIIRSIASLLDKKDWRQVTPLLVVMVISAILNAIGIAMVVPFIAVASNPEMIHTTHILLKVYHALHFTSDYHFLFFLGVIALLLLLIGNSLNVLGGWFSAKVSFNLYYRWVNTFLAAYLMQPYLFFLNTRTSELSRNLLREIASLSNLVFVIFSFFSACLSMLMIFLMLVMVNPLPAISIMISVGIIYWVIFIAIRGLLKKTSYYTNFAGQETFKISEEVFNMIKEVKLYHKEKVFIEAFESPTRLAKDYNALYAGITPMPRYLLEVIAFGGVILLVLYLLLAQHNLSTFLPMLGFFVVALYRVMPLMQNIFGQFSAILAGTHCVETVLADYQRLKIKEMQGDILDRFKTEKNFNCFQNLQLRNISFQYPNTLKPAILNLNLKIDMGRVIAFVGPSGAGKTTIVDILLGLLQPQSGELVVDGQVLNTEGKIRSWQCLLGYVPQAIMLTNNSIAQNIAFGELIENVDMERVKQAIQFAQLEDFVESLPEKYETLVGDRGIRLSGGQRQRIGIARALYRNPQVLILDEATNALDGLTEVEIMQNVHALAKEKTIIIIAHRLQTVMACDRLYYIDQGSLVAEGNYAELARTHEGFKQMVQVAEGNFNYAA